MLWEETQQALRAIEEKVAGPVVVYYTGSDSRIHDDDVKYFYSHLKKIGYQKKLYFILVSHGGNGQSAWRVANLLRNFCDELAVVLPEVAASAATMLSLAADEIIMTPLAYLTAVDTSIYHPLNPKDADNKAVYVELDEVNRSVNALVQDTAVEKSKEEVFKTIFNYIHPVAFGAVARSTNLSEMLCSDIMDLKKQKDDAKKKKEIIEKLNASYPSHSYPITRHKARELGLPVIFSDNELDTLLWSLLNNYVLLTKPVKTYLNKTAIHTETITTVIESVSLRFSMQHSLQKRLDTILKDWLTYKNEFHWSSLFLKEIGDKEILMRSELEF